MEPRISIAEIKKLHSLGFALHWLKPRSKMPVNSGWTKGERLSLDELLKTRKPSYNLGVRLGHASKLSEGYLAVIDIDVKSSNPKHAKEAEAKALELFPAADAGAVVLSGRGQGSKHFYVRLKEPVSGNDRKGSSSQIVKVIMPSADRPSKKELELLSAEELASGVRLRPAWEVSLLSEGRQVVLPGSVHPDTGRLYEWEYEPSTISDFPRVKAGPANSTVSKPEANTSGPTKREYPAVNPSRLGLRADQLAALEHGTGVEDRSAACFSLTMALMKRGVSEPQILALLTDRKYYLGNTAFEHAKTTNRDRAAYWLEKYCLRKAREKVNESAFDFAPKEETYGSKNTRVRGFEELGEETTLHEALGFKHEWQQDLDLQKGPAGALPTVKATFKNVVLILTNEVGEDLLARNMFANEDVWLRDTPWGFPAGRKRGGTFDDALHVKQWLIESQYRVEVGTPMIDEALSSIALQNKFHPVKDFLESLEWDGVERVERAFFTYLGARMPRTYQRAITRKFFQALIQRIYEPGCKFDHMVVFEGLQGIGKSTFGRILVSDEWFMDGLPEFSDKDAALNLQGIWLCEIAELAAIYRSANEQAKSFIARQVDKVRPPYGRRREDYARQSVFLGTTNAEEYLTDPTGNRRFWPVLIKGCDFKKLRADREQLLAEAFWCYKNMPEPLYLEGHALEQAVKIQESRRVELEHDAMYSAIMEWKAKQLKDDKDFNTKAVNLEDLFDRGPLITFQKTPSNRRSAGDAMRKAGFRKTIRKVGKRWTLASIFTDVAHGGKGKTYEEW